MIILWLVARCNQHSSRECDNRPDYGPINCAQEHWFGQDR